MRSSKSATLLDILTVDELANIEKTNPQFLHKTIQVNPIVKDLPSVLERFSGVERHRLLLGDVVWAYFFAYRAFNFGIVYLLQHFDEKGAFISPYADPALRSIAGSVLPKDQLDAAFAMNLGALTFIRRSLVTNILSELRSDISGRQASESSLKRAQEILMQNFPG